MQTTMAGVVALRKLRIEWQEDAGEDFPTVMLTELLVLNDVCKCLDLTIFQKMDVLGNTAWQCLSKYLDSPAGVPVDCRSVESSDRHPPLQK